ncbi:MAG TPA: hypothetical protein VIG72_08885, partial [Pontibacter sp.]
VHTHSSIWFYTYGKLLEKYAKQTVLTILPPDQATILLIDKNLGNYILHPYGQHQQKRSIKIIEPS